jgi:methionine-rich copper-binding protein CopC
MSDEKITTIATKNPADSSIAKIKEAASKEIQNKFDEQVKRALNAAKVYANEKKALQELKADTEQEKHELAELLKGL